jgi:hypothetical protein
MIDPATGNPTGDVFNTTTESDLGDFSLTIPQAGAAELMTTGFYFNEISGQLSAAPITLRALGDFTTPGSQSVYVNAVTQMSYRRAKKLIADGVPFADAVQQAEQELRDTFGLPQRSALGSGTAMNLLGGDTDDNAYLLAVSCVLAQAAENEKGNGSVDAKLSEIISKIALDLEPDSMLDASLSAILDDARQGLDGWACMANMQKRLTETGSSATVPTIFKALDFDEDGIVDVDDPDADGDGVLAADDEVLQIAGQLAFDAGGQLWQWDTPTNTHARVRASFGPAGVKAATRGTSQAGPSVVKGDGTVWLVPSGGGAPIQVSGLDQVVSLATGNFPGYGGQFADVAAVKSDGTVWTFHSNNLNDPPFQTAWTEIATIADATPGVSGYSHSVIKGDGTAWYQCTPYSPFVQIAAIAKAKAVGHYADHYAGIWELGWVLGSDGKLWVWYVNTDTCDPSSFTIAEATSNVVSIATIPFYQQDPNAPELYGNVVKADGTLWKLDATYNGTFTFASQQVPGVANAVTLSDDGNAVVTADGSLLARIFKSTEYTPVHFPR